MTTIAKEKVDRDLRARCYSSTALRWTILASRAASGSAKLTARRERTIHLAVAIASLSLFCLTSFAQNVERIETREQRRREAAVPHGEEALAAGKVAMKERNYAVAHEQFRIAVRYLPNSRHDEAVDGFCKSGVKLAEEEIAQGQYTEAEEIVQEVLDVRYDPNCRPALELLAHLRTPGYYNKTMGPKFIAKVEEVKKLLTDAEGY